MQHSIVWLKHAFTPLVGLAYPPRCPLCGEAIAEQRGLCGACWAELVIPGEPACALCQRPFVESDMREGTVCAPCLAHPPRHAGIAAGTLYNDASRKLVLAFKHGRKIALAPMLARLVAARLPALEGDWLAVPVPLHPLRLWQRGFNQSALLAGELAKMTGSQLLVDGLVRKKRTPPLGGMGRRERARMMAGAIDPHPARMERLKGANVLLVDDVMTSGSTSEACLRALRKAGAGRVKLACFARVLDEASR